MLWCWCGSGSDSKLSQRMSFGWPLELGRISDTWQTMKLQQGSDPRKHVHYQCSMHWRVVTLCQAFLAMGKRLRGLCFQSLPCPVETFFSHKWHTTGGNGHNWEVCYLTLWPNQHMHRNQYSKEEVICKGAQCANNGPGVNTRTTFTMRMGLVKVIWGGLWTLLDMPTRCRPVHLWTCLVLMQDGLCWAFQVKKSHLQCIALCFCEGKCE